MNCPPDTFREVQVPEGPLEDLETILGVEAGVGADQQASNVTLLPDDIEIVRENTTDGGTLVGLKTNHICEYCVYPITITVVNFLFCVVYLLMLVFTFTEVVAKVSNMNLSFRLR